MTSEALDLDLDLDLWEAGDLTRDEVVRRHGEEVAGLLDLFGRLESVAIEAAPYEEARWEALRSRLPGPAKPRRRPSFRAIALAAAAVLLLGAVAYAAVPTVRRQVNQVTQQVFGDPQPAPSIVKTTPAPASNPTGVSAIPTQSGNDQSSDDDQNTGGDQGSGDDENAGDNQGGGDNQNNDDDQTSGSGSDETGSANDEGSGGGSQGTSSDDSSTDDGQDQSSGDQAGGGTDQDG